MSEEPEVDQVAASGKKKAASGKKAAKKAAPKKKAAAPKAAKGASKKKAQPKAAAVDSIDEREAKKRLKRIYELEQTVVRRRAEHATHKSNARIAKAELVEAEEALAREIGEQRNGPGPLFDDLGDERQPPASSSSGKKVELRAVPPPSMPVPPAPSVIDQPSIDAGAST